VAARIAPDQAALEIAHRKLRTDLPLDAMLVHPTFRLILENVARRHMQLRSRFDAKRLQANDHD
jgi:hypothetical protein